MPTHRLPLNRLGASDIQRWAELGDSFESASMSGHPNDDGHGYLDDDWRNLHIQLAGKIFYVVKSYQTPIAWKIRDGWVLVHQIFSTTTSRHQGITRHLHPQRTFWCNGSLQWVATPDRGESRPADVPRTGQWGRCCSCIRPVAAPRGAAVEHLPALVRA